MTMAMRLMNKISKRVSPTIVKMREETIPIAALLRRKISIGMATKRRKRNNP